MKIYTLKFYVLMALISAVIYTPSAFAQSQKNAGNLNEYCQCVLTIRLSYEQYVHQLLFNEDGEGTVEEIKVCTVPEIYTQDRGIMTRRNCGYTAYDLKWTLLIHGAPKCNVQVESNCSSVGTLVIVH